MNVYCAGAGAALASLDRTVVGQWMLSRPVVLGPALGAALGDLQTGWWVGLMFELLSLDAQPVGGKIPLNGTVAASATLLAALGPWAIPMAAAFPLGLALGAGHRFVEEWTRRRRDAWTPVFASAMREGRPAPWTKAFAVSLFEEFSAAAAVLLIALAAAAAIAAGWDFVPVLVRASMADAAALVPVLATAVLIHRLARSA